MSGLITPPSRLPRHGRAARGAAALCALVVGVAGCTGRILGAISSPAVETAAASAPPSAPPVTPPPAAPVGELAPATPGASPPAVSSGPPAGVLRYALFNCSAGDYTADVQIGGRGFRLAVDTGATITSVAAAYCGSCGVTPTYQPGAEAKNGGLSIKEGYGDGSGWLGDIYTDKLTLGAGMAAFPLRIAAISQQTFTPSGRGYFFDSGCQASPDTSATQGTLALGNGVQNSAADDFAEAARAATGLQDVFAFQLCELGGQMWWGGYDPAAAAALPRYTPMDISGPYDLVSLADLSVAGRALHVAAAGPMRAMVDTGTNVMIFPSGIFAPLAAALAAVPVFGSTFGAGFLGSGACVPLPASVTRAQLDQMLPRLGLVFADEAGQRWTADLPASGSYLTRQVSAAGLVFCSAVVDGGAGGELTLGNEAIHSQVVIIDRAHRRMELAPQVGCP